MDNDFSCSKCYYWTPIKDGTGWCNYDRRKDGKINTPPDYRCGDMYVYRGLIQMLQEIRQELSKFTVTMSRSLLAIHKENHNAPPESKSVGVKETQKTGNEPINAGTEVLSSRNDTKTKSGDKSENVGTIEVPEKTFQSKKKKGKVRHNKNN